ncbi:hypothetical protein JP0557_10010 [Helicobacter pylori]
MLVDSFNRVIDYIRVSVTKQCNFRCQYCMPTTLLNFFDDEELLPLDNVLEFLKIAIDEGVKKIESLVGSRVIPSECFIGFFKKGFKNLSKRRS